MIIQAKILEKLLRQYTAPPPQKMGLLHLFKKSHCTSKSCQIVNKLPNLVTLLKCLSEVPTCQSANVTNQGILTVGKAQYR